MVKFWGTLVSTTSLEEALGEKVLKVPLSPKLEQEKFQTVHRCEVNIFPFKFLLHRIYSFAFIPLCNSLWPFIMHFSHCQQKWLSFWRWTAKERQGFAVVPRNAIFRHCSSFGENFMHALCCGCETCINEGSVERIIQNIAFILSIPFLFCPCKLYEADTFCLSSLEASWTSSFTVCMTIEK